MHEQRDTSVPRTQLKPETYIEWPIALNVWADICYFVLIVYLHDVEIKCSIIFTKHQKHIISAATIGEACILAAC